MFTKLRSVMIVTVVFVVALALLGCPQDTRQTVLLSTDLDAEKVLLVSKGGIEEEAIESLVVTVTEIALDRVGNSAGGNKVIAFSGEKDIELLDLMGVSEIISTAGIPAGKYTKIRLSIENPRMVLTENPEEIITNIHLTANSRLFVSETFEVPENQNSLILLDLQGIHLVATGDGDKYVWTPQLRALISVEPADVLLDGRIVSVDPAAETVEVSIGDDAELTLAHYGDADIFLLNDADTPTGTAADLTEGTRVVVEGVLSVTGEVVAEVIWVLE